MGLHLQKNKIQVLHFLLKNTLICIDICFIKSVVLLPLLKVVPNSPNYLAGIMNVAGNGVPVLDLSIRLGIKRLKPYSIDAPVLLCQENDHEIGLIVEKILGLTEVDQSKMQMQKKFDHPHSPFLGAININEELALMIDMKKIFSMDLIHHPNQVDPWKGLQDFNHE